MAQRHQDLAGCHNPPNGGPHPTEEALLLTEKEAARLLGFSYRTLQAWRVRGGGPPFIKVSPACVRYLRADLLAWTEAHRRYSTSDSGPDAGGASPGRKLPPIPRQPRSGILPAASTSQASERRP